MGSKVGMSSEQFKENITKLYGEKFSNQLYSSLSKSLSTYNIDMRNSAVLNRVYFDVLKSLENETISDITSNNPLNIVSNTVQTILTNEKIEALLDRGFNFRDNAFTIFSIPENSFKNRSTTYKLLYTTFLKQNPNIEKANIPTKYSDFLKKQGISVSIEDNEILNDLYSKSTTDVIREVDSSKSVITTTDINFDKLFESLQEVFPNVTKQQSLAIFKELSSYENHENMIERLKPDFKDYARQISEYMTNIQKENTEDIFKEIEIANLTSDTLHRFAIDKASVDRRNENMPIDGVQLSNVDSNSFHNFIDNENSLEAAFDNGTSNSNPFNSTSVDEILATDNYYTNQFIHFANQDENQEDATISNPFEFTPQEEHFDRNTLYDNSKSLIPQENKFIRAIKNFFANIGKPKHQLITDGYAKTKTRRTSESFNSFESRKSLKEAIRRFGDSTIGKFANRKPTATPVVIIPGLQAQVSKGIDNGYYDPAKFIPKDPTFRKPGDKDGNKHTLDDYIIRNKGIEQKAINSLKAEKSQQDNTNQHTIFEDPDVSK